ncbi:threonine/homoserine/homoserine lactone efflux protein [Bradyrhizobium sp. CIR3A]|nr:threonine/homoserine/homoserine lactone efflux protein [Bradyrhizobium sp. CIR3A]
MIQFDTLLTYIAVVLGLFLIPGPAVLLVLGRASVGGHRVGIATGLGIATGDLLHTAMATLGLSAVLMTSALAFSLVKYAGAAYLIYLGIRALMERGEDIKLAQSRLVDASLAFRQAVLAELLNPKTALFFLAFLPQFVHSEKGSVRCPACNSWPHLRHHERDLHRVDRSCCRASRWLAHPSSQHRPLAGPRHRGDLPGSWRSHGLAAKVA